MVSRWVSSMVSVLFIHALVSWSVRSVVVWSRASLFSSNARDICK